MIIRQRQNIWLSGEDNIYDYQVNTKYMIIMQTQNIWLSGEDDISDYQVKTIYMQVSKKYIIIR